MKIASFFNNFLTIFCNSISIHVFVLKITYNASILAYLTKYRQHKKTGNCQSFKKLLSYEIFRSGVSSPLCTVHLMIYIQTSGGDSYPATSQFLLCLYLFYHQSLFL